VLAAVDALIGTWRTRGDVFGDDGVTVVARVDGTDAYEWLGRSFVIHRIDVMMADDHVEGIEIIGPYDAGESAFRTQAYDNEGGIQQSTAAVDADGVWTFGADGAKATLRPDANGREMNADWVRSADDGATWLPWLRLNLQRT